MAFVILGRIGLEVFKAADGIDAAAEKDQADALFAEIDTDGDGSLQFDEFDEFLTTFLHLPKGRGALLPDQIEHLAELFAQFEVVVEEVTGVKVAKVSGPFGSPDEDDAPLIVEDAVEVEEVEELEEEEAVGGAAAAAAGASASPAEEDAAKEEAAATDAEEAVLGVDAVAEAKEGDKDAEADAEAEAEAGAAAAPAEEAAAAAAPAVPDAGAEAAAP